MPCWLTMGCLLRLQDACLFAYFVMWDIQNIYVSLVYEIAELIMKVMGKLAPPRVEKQQGNLNVLRQPLDKKNKNLLPLLISISVYEGLR